MRVKKGQYKRKKHKKMLKAVKGMNHYRTSSARKAREALLKSWSNAYKDRRRKKRDFRSLWIRRISAACRLNGTTYSEFQKNLKEKNIQLDRKSLADIAATEPEVFKEIVKKSK